MVSDVVDVADREDVWHVGPFASVYDYAAAPGKQTEMRTPHPKDPSPVKEEEFHGTMAKDGTVQFDEDTFSE